jgi:hypothetical protein
MKKFEIEHPTAWRANSTPGNQESMEIDGSISFVERPD